MSNILAAGLLAPVPESHLLSGIDVCREEGKVAFGTRVWDAFGDLEREAGIGAPVLIYASHSAEHAGARVSWVANFAGWVAASQGGHPSGQQYRPVSTRDNNEDQSGHWLGFWEVTGLRKLAAEERIEIRSLKDRRGRKYVQGFIPEGPILISTTGSIR